MSYEITLITTMAISVLFALSLNFISGFCGQISLGHAAFLGAYGTQIATALPEYELHMNAIDAFRAEALAGR